MSSKYEQIIATGNNPSVITNMLWIQHPELVEGEDNDWLFDMIGKQMAVRHKRRKTVLRSGTVIVVISRQTRLSPRDANQKNAVADMIR
jgi:hypothetical protein